MKVGILFSGGKDSVFAMHKIEQEHEVVCLISILSENEESYMFHTPNIDLTKLQAEAIDLPLLQFITKGVKEEELIDLKFAIADAKDKFGIEGIVTGAVESVYQSSRIQKICDDLGLKCINPLWKMNQVKLLKEIINSGFKVLIIGVFAYPLEENWLGREITSEVINELIELNKKYEVSPVGEGGELETFVFDGPCFKKKINILESEKEFKNNAGKFIIKKAELEV